MKVANIQGYRLKSLILKGIPIIVNQDEGILKIYKIPSSDMYGVVWNVDDRVKKQNKLLEKENIKKIKIQEKEKEKEQLTLVESDDMIIL